MPTISNRNRYVLSGVLLIAALAAGAYGLLRMQNQRVSAAIAEDHLDAIRGAQALVEGARNDRLKVRAELIASNQAVTGYIVQALESALPGTETDYASVVDLLEERRGQLGLALAAVLDAEGRIVAITEPLAGRESFADLPAFVEARERQQAGTAVLSDRTRLLGIAIQPLAVYGASEAYLLVAMPVNQAYAESIAEVGSAEVAVLMPGADGVLVAASTLNPAESTQLLAAIGKDSGKRDGRFDIEVGGVAYRAALAPLSGDREARLLALVPKNRESATLSESRRPLAIAVAVALALALLAMAWLWLRIYAPAEALAKVMEHSADSGDFRVKVQGTGARPLARLAEAFNRLCARATAAKP